MIGLVFHLWIISTISAVSSTPEFDDGLANKHLVVAAKHWKPFLIVDKDSEGTITYSGIMYELLRFMQQARNLTLSIISEDTQWGTCDENDLCTGMFEMVNKSKVDIALGKLRQIGRFLNSSIQKLMLSFRSVYPNLWSIQICRFFTYHNGVLQHCIASAIKSQYGVGHSSL